MISAAAAASGADLLDRPYTESLAGNWPPAVSASAAVYVVINAQSARTDAICPALERHIHEHR